MLRYFSLVWLILWAMLRHITVTSETGWKVKFEFISLVDRLIQVFTKKMWKYNIIHITLKSFISVSHSGELRYSALVGQCYIKVISAKAEAAQEGELAKVSPGWRNCSHLHKQDSWSPMRYQEQYIPGAVRVSVYWSRAPQRFSGGELTPLQLPVQALYRLVQGGRGPATLESQCKVPTDWTTAPPVCAKQQLSNENITVCAKQQLSNGHITS